jgi:hypothetical protein
MTGAWHTLHAWGVSAAAVKLYRESPAPARLSSAVDGCRARHLHRLPRHDARHPLPFPYAWGSTPVSRDARRRAAVPRRHGSPDQPIRRSSSRRWRATAEPALSGHPLQGHPDFLAAVTSYLRAIPVQVIRRPGPGLPDRRRDCGIVLARESRAWCSSRQSTIPSRESAAAGRATPVRAVAA